MPAPILFTLPNGLRCVFQHVKSPVAHIGVTIMAGSRFETKEEEGLAHFLEHAIFKGTKKRKSHHILSRLDAVGGELNAYTSKEEMCIYASFSKKHLNRSMELLADIAFNANFPEKELQKEKDVIIDEVNSYLDNPSDEIFDEFEALMFPNHSLGYNILGTKKSLRSLERKHLLNYFERFFHPENMVLSIVGPYSEKRIQEKAHHFFAGFQRTGKTSKLVPFNQYQIFLKEQEKSNHQSHVLIGNIAYPYKSKEQKSLFLLNNFLGGPALNSILSLALREKHGLSYNVESSYTPYMDTGFFCIYFSCDKQHLQKSLQIVKAELKKLCSKPLSVVQLARAKEQLKGHLNLASESNSGLMLSLGKSLLFFNKIDSLKEIHQEIDSITSEGLLKVAKEVLDEKRLSTLIYQPKHR